LSGGPPGAARARAAGSASPESSATTSARWALRNRSTASSGANEAAPVVVARIYNDGGVAGTNGFAQPAFKASDASAAGDSGTFILPADATNYHFNIGIRTLDDGVTATFTVWDSLGVLVHTAQKNLPLANSLTLDAGGQFLDGITLPPNGSIGGTVTQGSAIFFGAVVDNRTLDGSTQFMTHGN